MPKEKTGAAADAAAGAFAAGELGWSEVVEEKEKAGKPLVKVGGSVETPLEAVPMAAGSKPRRFAGEAAGGAEACAGPALPANPAAPLPSRRAGGAKEKPAKAGKLVGKACTPLPSMGGTGFHSGAFLFGTFVLTFVLGEGSREKGDSRDERAVRGERHMHY